jgi:cation/acetate symporter
MAENIPANWLFGISPEGIGGIGMILNFVTAWLVSKVTSAPPESVQLLIESIRSPRGTGAATSH